MKTRFGTFPKFKFQMSELGRYLATQSLAKPREFITFPAVWGRQVRWVKPTGQGELSFMPMSAKEAKERFENGEVVHYVAKGFPYSIRYSPIGMEPT